ncbi:MAG: putative toxin-antitoxin system toxin component, PIN family [Chloroflexi bacterium]|nr:MAG: putative toxin-antitoxin system toxin component, PIN family [Chloroflexota bacterium]
MRAVIDTGVLVSALIRRQGTTGGILHAMRDGRFTLVYSTAIVVEIIEVLGREPFRVKYHIQSEDITALVNLIRLRGELVNPTHSVKMCRDPKDDKFLKAALAGKAEAIVSSDADLLVLNLFEGSPVLRPADFLALV